MAVLLVHVRRALEDFDAFVLQHVIKCFGLEDFDAFVTIDEGTEEIVL